MQEGGPTVFSPFPADTDYFGRMDQPFMLNFRVDDLDFAVEKLREAGVRIDDQRMAVGLAVLRMSAALGGGDDVFPYQVEGIGYDFFPDVLDNDLVDDYVKVNDQDSFVMARRLIKEEGLLCGGSSGTAMVAALEKAKDLEATQKCLVILPDGVRNYLSKFLTDEWMKKEGFME